jgi:hypothetical protein
MSKIQTQVAAFEIIARPVFLAWKSGNRGLALRQLAELISDVDGELTLLTQRSELLHDLKNDLLDFETGIVKIENIESVFDEVERKADVGTFYAIE